jgi:hypothetical protein
MTGKALNSLIKPPLLIVSHDAGGAEVLAAWCRVHLDMHHAHFCIAGPALSRFQPWLSPTNQITLAQLDLRQYATVLTSTSSAEVTLERSVIQQAQAYPCTVISFIDHWTNYLERFMVNDRHYFPDYIVTSDAYAEKQMRQLLANTKSGLTAPNTPRPAILREPNEYLIQQQQRITAIENSLGFMPDAPQRILYVTEPAEHDVSALAAFLADLPQLVQVTQGKNYQLRIRLHPKENPEKYRHLFTHASSNIAFSSGTTLAEDIAWAQSVVGLQTMAMVVALAAQRQVFSSLPAEVERSQLPQEGIRQLYCGS